MLAVHVPASYIRGGRSAVQAGGVPGWGGWLLEACACAKLTTSGLLHTHSKITMKFV